MRYLFIAAVTLFAAPASPSQPFPAASAPAPVQAKSDRVVCRSDDEIGSRLRKTKICLTVAQWRDLQYRTGSVVDRNSASVARPGG